MIQMVIGGVAGAAALVKYRAKRWFGKDNEVVTAPISLDAETEGADSSS